MDLLSVSEKNNVESVLSNCEIISQAVAKLYLAFPNPNEWSFSNHVGVVNLVKQYNNFSFKMVDPEKREIIWEYDIDSNMTYQKNEDYLHVFPYKIMKCNAGFSFTSESEAQIFYNCVVNRNIGKVSPVSSRIGSPKLPTVSPVATTIKIDTKKDDKKKHKKDKKDKKKKKGLFGFGSSKSKSKSKKGKIDKSQIGKPTNFRHEQYIGYDPEKGFVTQNAGPEWQEIFKKAGITPEVLADDKSRKIVNNFIKQYKDSVVTAPPALPATPMKKEKRPPPPPPPKKRPPPPPPQKRPNQTRKAPPPPPPPHRKNKKAPPPPPPTRKPVKQTKSAVPPPPSRPAPVTSSIPPPPPSRPAPAASVSIPPPPPIRPAPATSSIPAPPPPPTRPTPATSSIPAPPPPPPTTSSIPAPPPPPPTRPTPATSSIPAPPPPPPTTSSVPAPPPPPPARPAPATSSVPAPPPPPPAPSTGNAKSDLLASIRNAGGISSLKHVDESQKRDASGLITAGSAAGPRPLPTPPSSSSGPQVGMSNDLLASIRNAGIGSLKHVDRSKIRDASSAKPSSSAPADNTNDLAAALAQALSLRNDAFGSDDDSDSDSDESDSDSSEWSD